MYFEFPKHQGWILEHSRHDGWYLRDVDPHSQSGFTSYWSRKIEKADFTEGEIPSSYLIKDALHAWHRVRPATRLSTPYGTMTQLNETLDSEP